jgi:hypothetical protein
MAARLTLAEHDDLAERVFLLKEAVRELLHFHDLEEAGHRPPGTAARWAAAWRDARDALDEEPDDRGAARC